MMNTLCSKVFHLRIDTMGHEVLEAATGLQTIEIATKTCPDLVILDFFLPDINGDEVSLRLKALPNLSQLPIIFMSASSVDFLPIAKARGFPFLRLGISFNPPSTCKLTGLLSFFNGISFQGYGFLRNPSRMPYGTFEKH